jgi:hypothetical protein
MTTKTRIKNLTSTTANAPTILKTGEFGYSYGTGTQANGGDRLYIGTGAEDGGTGIASHAPVVGGKYFVDMLDHVAGTLTAGSAIIVDANSKIDNLKVDDLVLDGSTISSAQAITISTTASSSDIILSPNETGKTVLHNPYINGTDDTLAEFIYDTVGGVVTEGTGITVTNDDVGNTSTIKITDTGVTAGSTGSATAIPVITFNAQGQITAVTTAAISSTLDIQADTGTDDGVLIGTDTLIFAGGTGIDTSVSGDTVTFAIDSTVATKTYVDGVAQGLDVKKSVRVATTADLSATYANGAGTLTADANGAIQIDGVTLIADDRVLVKDQTTQTENGFYKVTTVGDGSTAFVLTRTPDADSASEITGGAFTFVEDGTANAENGYVATHNGEPTLGTTNITFEQFSGAGQITAGTGLTKTGNTINAVGTVNRITANADTIDIASTYVGQASITTLGTITTGVWNGTTVAVPNGGTGVTSFTDNGVVYGDGTNALDVTAASSADGSILQADDGAAPAFSNIIDGGTY